MARDVELSTEWGNDEEEWSEYEPPTVKAGSHHKSLEVCGLIIILAGAVGDTCASPGHT